MNKQSAGAADAIDIPLRLLFERRRCSLISAALIARKFSRGPIARGECQQIAVMEGGWGLPINLIESPSIFAFRGVKLIAGKMHKTFTSEWVGINLEI